MLAGALLKAGEPVTGLVRRDASVEQLNHLGISALQVDLDQAVKFNLDLENESIFYFIPPPSAGVEDTRLQHFLAALSGHQGFKKLVLISTTGVYGDCGGEWVDEQRPVNPRFDRAKRRWHAEQQLRAYCHQHQGEHVVLRVAGIYGPGHLPLERLRKRLPMVPESEAPWTNRIHALDLVQVCQAAMARGRDGEVYNVSDGHPGNMTDYFNQVADHVGLLRPPVVKRADADGQLSAGMLSYLQESRRLSHQKMIEELQVTLQYPSLKSGLMASF